MDLNDSQKATLKLLGLKLVPGTVYKWVIRSQEDNLLAIYDPRPNSNWSVIISPYADILNEVLNGNLSS